MNNNLENGYTEELDFSNIKEEMEKAKQEVKPVPLEPMYEEAPVETYDDIVNNRKIEDKKLDTEINENPNAKVTLNKEEEEPEQIDPKDIKIDLKGNKSLMKVLMLGLFLLIIIILIPLIAL